MFRDDFTRMLKTYPKCVEDKKVFTSYMKDLFPSEKLLTNVLSSLLELGIIEDIQNSSELNAPFSYKYTKNLMDNYGYSEEHAGNAVFLWCVCYGEGVIGKKCDLEPHIVKDIKLDENKSRGLYQDLFSYRMNRTKYVITGCNDSSIKTLVVPNKLHGKLMTAIDMHAFAGMDNLEQTVITDGVIEIGAAAFSSCSKLRQAILPYGIRNIADEAFAKCESLMMINIPETVISVGDYALENTAIKNVIIPDSVAIVGKGIFRNCKKLMGVQLNNSMNEIPDEMFQSCSELKKITLTNNIKRIGKKAFMECRALHELIIPDCVETIENDAFLDASPELVIVCDIGSEAERFARLHHMKFQLM